MKFLWPIDKPYRWISGYHFNPPSHDAEDFGTPNGAQYRAPQSGWIIAARFTLKQDVTGYIYGYGNYITIDHGEGWRSLGAHLLDSYVQVGDWVEAGQLIARTNNTGNSSGPHLHFKLSINGTPVKPSSYLGDVIVPEPPPVPDPEIPELPIAVVNVEQGSRLNIRNYPKDTSTAKIIGSLGRGDEVEVQRIVMDGFNKWLKIGHDQYICMLWHNIRNESFKLCVWK